MMYCNTLPVVQVVLHGSSAVLSAVKNQVSVSAVEASVQTLRNRNQFHVLHPPHLKARPLTCTLKLRMEHHDVTAGGGATKTPEQHDVTTGGGATQHLNNVMSLQGAGPLNNMSPSDYLNLNYDFKFKLCFSRSKV